MITSPLELKRYLTEPDLRFDTVPLLDLCLIGLFLAFQSSRFIASPGITLDIPDVDKEVLSGIPTSAVVTVLTPKVRTRVRGSIGTGFAGGAAKKRWSRRSLRRKAGARP